MAAIKEDRKLHLHRLVILVRGIYPEVQTKLPAEISYMYSYIDKDDYMLYDALVHCLTVLNRPGRLQEGRQLLSSQQDLLNALHLLLPRDDQLTPRILACHESLSAHFSTSWFGYVEAIRYLKVSERTVHRMFKVLVLYGLLDRDYQGEHKRARFRVSLTRVESAVSMFSEANEDWEDFIGFVEF